MNKLALSLTVGAALSLVAMLSSPAQAQLAQTWVASNGNNGNDCSRSTPCASFGGAYAKTTVGGEINCADSGSFGSVSITTSVTVNCEGVVGSTTNAGAGAGQFLINTAASDRVVLKGLIFDGHAVEFGATGAIFFLGAGTLHVDNVTISNIRGGASGIRFTPAGGPAKLDVSNSLITDTGTNINTAGILIRPGSGANANVTISRTGLHGNVNGIYLDGSGGGSAANLNVRDSVITGSSNCGVVVVSNGPALTTMIDRTTINSSLNVGVAVSGAGATVSIGNSTISGNVTGVSAINGGGLRSFKNNQIKFNLANGTPIAAVDALD